MTPRLPRVTCGGYVTASGARIRCDRVIRPGEPGGREVVGTCVTCGGLQKRAWAQKAARGAARVRRNAARGYGGPAEGEDVFRGFREGE